MTKNYRFEIFSYLFYHNGEYTDISPVLNKISAEAGYSCAYLLILLEALRKNDLISLDETMVLNNNPTGMGKIQLPLRAYITPDGLAEYRRLEKMTAFRRDEGEKVC